MNRYNRPSIQGVTFDEYTRTLIFNELHERFGFPIKEWKKKFSDEMLRRPRNVSADDYFPYFADTYINPLLNEILCRNKLYPTFNKFVHYVINRHG